MNTNKTYQLKWVDALKAFAILGILFNHLVECFGYFPWFSNPEYSWPCLHDRISMLLPHTGNIFIDIADFFGWLGDMGPGVFILLSGFTITLSLYRKNTQHINLKDFFLQRYFRIWPLYFVIHIFITVLAIFVGIQSFDPKSITYLISLSGFRFTEQLFFYLNPSWWFIWLIFQLYLVFPLLYRWLRKIDLKWFIVITLGVTLGSRGLGLFGKTYSDSLYLWMTGLFFGTRLFEFAIGMVLAKAFVEKKKLGLLSYGWFKTIMLGLVIYSLGFCCSLFWYSTLLSNILISVGLSGILLGVWKWVEAKTAFLTRQIIWIGKMSFPVFLLHQPLMMWLPGLAPESWKLPLLLLIAVVSLPVGWLLEKATTVIVEWVRIKLVLFQTKAALALVSLIAIGTLPLNILYGYFQSSFVLKLCTLALSAAGLLSIVFVLTNGDKNNKTIRQTIALYAVVALLFTIVLPPHWMPLFWIFACIVIVLFLLICKFTRGAHYSAFAAFLFAVLLFLASELYLRKTQPVEAGRWGEQPALQIDTQTIYSLIPNKKTQLRYNNYDYIVKTNSFGFNSPEIAQNEKYDKPYRIFIMGDAFSMPEGMEYEKAYPYLLEQLLTEKYPERNIQIINGAVTGYGPNEMLATCKKYIDTLKPDLIINQIFINELHEVNLSPEMRQGEIGLLEISKRREVLERCQIPAHWTRLSRKINPETDKIYREQKSLIGLYDRSSAYYSEENTNKIKEYLIQLNALCVNHQSQLVVLFAPGQLEVSKPEHIAYYPYHIDTKSKSEYDFDLPTKLFGEICAEHNILYLDPRAHLRTSKKQPVYYPESWHWNPIGHKLISEYLANEVSNLLTENK